MERRAAEEIVPILLKASQDVADTMAIHERLSGSKSKEYAKAVGEVIFAFDGLLRPILNEHPDLRPWERETDS
jgi:hypothetical protein